MARTREQAGTGTAVATEGAPSVTVVVPTRNEAGNVEELVRRLDAALGGDTAEVVFVDDSDDGTPGVIQALAPTAGRPLRLIHRAPEERTGGLGGAVLAGLRRSRGDYVVCMDGDLQHPPEVVPALLDAARRERADVVVASRYCSSGGAGGLSSTLRHAVSNSATALAKLSFPRRLSGTTDPMSGFFVVRRAAVDAERLRPCGFKILLEILVRTPGLSVTERPFTFAERLSGDSKAGLREGLRFVRHMIRLRSAVLAGDRVLRAARFGAVGLSGIVVNTLALILLAGTFGVPYLLAAVLATQVSTAWNFALTEAVVFRGPKPRSLLGRFVRFAGLNNAALLLRVPVLALLVDGLGMGYVVANLLTLLGLFLLRFLVADHLIYSTGGSMSAVMHDPPAAVPRTPRPRREPVDVVVDLTGSPSPAGLVPQQRRSRSRTVVSPVRDYLQHRYSLHGIVTVGSEVALAELEFFRVPMAEGPFDIEIRAGDVGSPRRRTRLTCSATPAQLRYEEHLGRRGANFSVDLGEPIQVTVGSLLVASPHVLYTNVIEALLRFVLVSRGHMLLHSACLDFDGTGVMLSARTDTGKTGTVLRLLREGNGRFLSDDMTILDGLGTALCFPKPLTISQHTLRAVQAGDLTKGEWRRLRVQSRLHSKEGRNLGQKLGEINVPIMAFNALTQWVVPPPKYAVDRLVRCQHALRTQVRDLFLIERAPLQLADVAHAEALETLIENTDDAYGFPPFRYFAPGLVIGEDGYEVLRLKERGILASAMREVRIRRLATDDFSWADRIPALAAQPRLRDCHAPVEPVPSGMALLHEEPLGGGI